MANQKKSKFTKLRKTFLPLELKGIFQKARWLITLAEYMPKGFGGALNALSCHQIEGEGDMNVRENKINPHYDAYGACVKKITFTNDDLLLGLKFHNQLLFATKFIWEQKKKRILVDNGSVVNIIPLRIMKQLDIPMND